MKKNASYALRRLHGVPYLLPFGQGNAELRRSVQLDEAGVFLWDALDSVSTERELTERFLARVGADGAQVREAEADVRGFLHTLRALGILADDTQPPSEDASRLTLAIGALGLRLTGGAAYWSDAFLPFAQRSVCSDAPCQTVSVSEAPPPACAGARVVLENDELAVFDAGERYYLRFPQFAALRLAVLRRDGGAATLHVRRPASPAEEETLREALFHAVRHTFLYFAARHGCFALHSASILYRGRAWLFSAPAGTGKSTQAALWGEAYGTPCLNGDLNLLSLRDENGEAQAGRAFVHGLPWCGTSGVATVGCTELGGIVLLRQAPRNRLEALRADQKQLYAANRLISPAWTEEQLAANLAFADALAQRVPVWRYHCTKEPDAAAFLRAEIDRTLASEE